MNKKEAAVMEAYTGVCMLVGDDRKYVHDYVSELFGRSVFTHEMASDAEKIKALSRKDFINICANVTDETYLPCKSDTLRPCVVNENDKGYFHMWANRDTHGTDGNILSKTYGIVELLNGNVIRCLPEMIRFTDRKGL